MHAKSRLSSALQAVLGLAGIAAAIALGGCGEGADRPFVVRVSMTNQDQFEPRDVVVAPGTIVIWTNNDADPHTATADPANPVANGPNSDSDFPNGVPGGQSWSWRAPLKATVGIRWFYHCRFHGQPGNGSSPGTGMSGSITVRY